MPYERFWKQKWKKTLKVYPTLRQVIFSFEHYFQRIQNTDRGIKYYGANLFNIFKTNDPALIGEKFDVRKSLNFYGNV